ncbi:uncharacterized protein FOBCDRAFT_296691 [Fusarium oxysporum Fo47]|uniref:uncharacterized protein n=1 Tax=Fusarium oxysporum Fo47 TaxID=660027 RepID=UPI002869B717|nr:uncharacterized protein FOBCDRAFT_296691 [Fusarium oxysporum Fo47]WJG35980.1 hypothetical protein FOBCDRAFT_296691 [Fusarium oxysporum Fo47]
MTDHIDTAEIEAFQKNPIEPCLKETPTAAPPLKLPRRTQGPKTSRTPNHEPDQSWTKWAAPRRQFSAGPQIETSSVSPGTRSQNLLRRSQAPKSPRQSDHKREEFWTKGAAAGISLYRLFLPPQPKIRQFYTSQRRYLSTFPQLKPFRITKLQPAQAYSPLTHSYASFTSDPFTPETQIVASSIHRPAHLSLNLEGSRVCASEPPLIHGHIRLPPCHTTRVAVPIVYPSQTPSEQVQGRRKPQFCLKASYRDSCVAALFKWQFEIHDNAGMHSPLPAPCCFVGTGQSHHSIPSLVRG